MLFSFLFVKKEPFSKVKTGEFSTGFDSFFSFFKAAIGQQLNFLNSKRLIVSPPSVRVLGILLWIFTESSLRNVMSDQSSVS